MTKKKKATPNSARRPRAPKLSSGQKRERLIESLLSVDELGQVAGGYVCKGACEGV